jgi:hypothetical protein
MENKGFIYQDGKAFETDRPWTVEGSPKIYDSEQDALSYGRLDDTLKNMQRPPSALYDKDWKKEQLKKTEKKEENSNFCFISTACFSSLGIDSEQVELQKLRNYRDNYLSKLPKGSEYIQEYYSLAPQIVKNINAAKNSLEIYSFLFNSMIMPAIDMIDSKQFEDAQVIYSQGFEIIKRNYL